MKNAKTKKLLSFLLVLCMTVSLLPGHVWAIGEDETASSPETSESTVEELLEPIIVTEDITKRGESEKHFLCDDGSYIAVSYPSPVHEQVEGQWVDVEYDVAEDSNGISPVDETIKVKLANNTNSAKLVKLEAGGYKISWTVEAENEDGDTTEKVKLSKDSKAAIKTNKEITKANKELLKNAAKYSSAEVFELKDNAKKKIESLKKAKSANVENDSDVASANAAIEDYNRQQILSVAFAQSNVEYVGAFGEGTTLRYLLTPGSINEEVVLNKYDGFKSYSMVMDTDGLTPVKNEFGRVDLTDGDGNVVVSIAPPYMYDSADALSEAVDVTVSRESKKSWRITYTPDADWLADQSRVYPVVIDPSVSTWGYPQIDQLDTYVRAGQTYAFNDSGPTLYVGYYGGENQTYWGVENLPAISSGSTVTGASFNIKFQGGTTSMGTIGLYFVSSALNTGTMMWSNKPSLGTKLGEISSVPGDLWLRYSSTELCDKLKNYYRMNWSNFGFALKYESQINDWNQFYSSDYTVNNSASIPYLEVRYTISFESVAEGTYYLQNVYTGKYLCASGSSVYLSDYAGGGTAVQWTIQKNEYYPSTYNIVPNANTSLGLYLNADYGSITLPAKASDGFGRWQFEKLDSVTYLIVSSGRPWMSLTGSGTSVYPSVTNADTPQQWQITTTPPSDYSQAIEPGLYYIKNVYEGKYLTTDTKIEVNTYEASSTQRWIVNKNADNTYSIYPSDDTSYGIGVYKGVTVDEQVLSCDIGNPIASQKMNLINNGDGSYSIVPDINKIYRLDVYTGATETKTINGEPQTMSQNTTLCLGLSSSSNTQKWIFEPTTDKKAVILIHGRASNSFGCWGASNPINLGDNDHYLLSIDGTSQGTVPRVYSAVGSQWLTGQTLDNGISVGAVFNEGYVDGELVSAQENSDHEGNLAYYLKQQGYIENVNLFVFNYPNEDIVKNSAMIFKTYIDNLITYAKETGSSEMKHAFGIHGNDYSFNIVGHSMGGLVARYYIENCTKPNHYSTGIHDVNGNGEFEECEFNDHHVEKLITIDTPHWGSGYANLSNATGIKHSLCDHDLAKNSLIFDETKPDLVPCDSCGGVRRVTDTLNYSKARQTKYYAIAGVDYNAVDISDNNYSFEMPTTFTTYQQLNNYLKDLSLYKYDYIADEERTVVEYIDSRSEGDNIVGLLSQIGWTETFSQMEPTKKITMEKIFINVDTNGGNGTDDLIEMVNHFHGKNQHRTDVISKVYDYLQE